uniref:Aquaporin n=1 Tax=Panagrolaimus sp. PS1159 TaxID=55785 RepID=A0AC35F4X9_9BILA
MSLLQYEQFMENLRTKLHLRNPRVVNVASEFYGMIIFIFMGVGIVMQYILSYEKLNTWIQVNLGWGFALALSVLICSKTSGGHLNPAVSFLFVTQKMLSFPDFILYTIVQTLGAFIGAGLSYFVYYDQVQHYSGDLRAVYGPKATAGLFCSFPAPHLSNFRCFVDQVFGTALLTTFISGIIDKRNGIPNYLHSLLFGITLITIGTAYGMNLGYPINPARDLGPRIFASLIYGTEVFKYHDYYFWIPVIAPFFGALLGSWLYHLIVGFQIQEPKRVVVLERTTTEEIQQLE